MIKEHDRLFEKLVFKSLHLGKSEVLQNDKCAFLLKISFEHAKEQEKKLFSFIINLLPETTNDILQDALKKLDGLSDVLKSLPIVAQRRIVELDMPEYLKHAEKFCQIQFVDKDIEYLKHAAKEVRFELVSQRPDKYFQHVTEEERLEIFKEDSPSSFRVAGEDLQEEYLKKGGLGYLTQAVSENLRSRFLAEDPGKWLYKLSEEDQIDFLKVNGLKSFNGLKCFQYASFDVQEELLQANPEKWLGHTGSYVQEELSNEDPKKYLKHAIHKVQFNFLSEKGETYFQYAAPYLQFLLSLGDPRSCLEHAIKEVQVCALLETEGIDLHHALLQYASVESRQEYENKKNEVSAKEDSEKQLEIWFLAELPQLPEDLGS
jgi:hypothetical protein